MRTGASTCNLFFFGGGKRRGGTSWVVCGYYTLYFWDIIRFYIHPTNPPNAPRSLAYHEETDIFILFFYIVFITSTTILYQTWR